MADVYLPADSQRRLIEIARQTLEATTRRSAFTQPSPYDFYLDQIKYGAFVTLFNQSVLRGCVGTCMPSSALAMVVIEMTEAAATRDRRVKPVHVDELDRIHIHITVVSPLERTDNPLGLEIGRHGLYVSRNGKQGVLLPQVAVERGWSQETFLEQTCLKASLPGNAWLWKDTKISLFTGLMIEEER